MTAGTHIEYVRAFVRNLNVVVKQVNLYGLPTDLVVRCLEDFVTETTAPDREIRHYEDWLIASYGRTFAETFPMHYTRKIHTTDARNLTADWMGPRMYRPSLEEVLRGALSPKTADVHYIDRFRYPNRGGFYSYMKPIHDASGFAMNVMEQPFRWAISLAPFLYTTWLSAMRSASA